MRAFGMGWRERSHCSEADERFPFMTGVLRSSGTDTTEEFGCML